MGTSEGAFDATGDRLRRGRLRRGRLRRGRLLVTGGAGFLGSHVVERFRRGGRADVFVPRSRDYDLVEREAVRRLFDDARPDVVIHLAALVGGIGANRDRPGEFLYRNLVMGLQVVEEARLRGVAKLVLVGTVCSYPRDAPVPFRESSLWDGYPEPTNAPYGLAKKMLLVQADAYRRQYGLRAIQLLPTNLYGPRDDFDLDHGHVIPALVRKCVEARRAGRRVVDVWGTGAATREFLFVEDAAEAVFLATERYEGAEPVNVGSGLEVAIRDLATLVARLTGFEGEIRFDPSKPDGQPRRCLDVSRAAAAFGFRATTDLEEGLRRTVAWYLAQEDGLGGA